MEIVWQVEIDPACVRCWNATGRRYGDMGTFEQSSQQNLSPLTSSPAGTRAPTAAWPAPSGSVRPRISGRSSCESCGMCGLFGCSVSTWCHETRTCVGPNWSRSDTTPSSWRPTAPRLRVNPGRVSTLSECLLPPGSAPERYFISRKAVESILTRTARRNRSLRVLQHTPTGWTAVTITCLNPGGVPEYWRLSNGNDSRVLPRDGLLDYLTGSAPSSSATG